MNGISKEIFGLVCIFVVLYPLTKIFVKAGFNPLMAVLMFIPVVNLGLLYYLAFSKWPNSR